MKWKKIYFFGNLQVTKNSEEALALSNPKPEFGHCELLPWQTPLFWYTDSISKPYWTWLLIVTMLNFRKGTESVLTLHLKWHGSGCVKLALTASLSFSPFLKATVSSYWQSAVRFTVPKLPVRSLIYQLCSTPAQSPKYTHYSHIWVKSKGWVLHASDSIQLNHQWLHQWQPERS